MVVVTFDYKPPERWDSSQCAEVPAGAFRVVRLGAHEEDSCWLNCNIPGKATAMILDKQESCDRGELFPLRLEMLKFKWPTLFWPRSWKCQITGRVYEWGYDEHSEGLQHDRT